jgi:signal transduction histidine kinase/ActR/RegA family two-component response regulator
MSGAQADQTDSLALPSRRALDLAHRLLTASIDDSLDLLGVLQELTAAFATASAGLSLLDTGKSLARHPASEEPLPWQSEPALLTRLHEEPTALGVPRPAGGSFLVTALPTPGGSGWLLWLEDAARSTWAKDEEAALAVVGQALARRLAAKNGPRWASQMEPAARQQRLEDAALVARRLAHDYGNVLTAILGFSELSLGPGASSSQLRGYLTEILSSARTGAALTDRVRLFARRSPCPAASCRLAAALIEEEARLRPFLGAVALRVDVPPDLPNVGIQQEALRNVLGALLDNAREALSGSGTIAVAARTVRLTAADCLDAYGDLRPGEHVEIRIADNGPGLSPEAARKLFVEPFFTDKPRGRGYGLVVAYGVLRARRGGLLLRPGDEGGVTALVFLPVAAVPTAEPAPSSLTQKASGPVQGERVLVVDDDPMILQLVCTTLQQAGYRVAAARSADEAFACYAGAAPEPFQLVLSDVIMPRASGVELARRLLGRDAEVRLLFMSGQASPDFARQDSVAGRFDLLSKPFQPEGLLRAVRRALDRTSPRRSAIPATGVPVSQSSTSR